MTWFEEWFDENYLELYADRDPRDAEKQADLIIKILGKTTGPWLDLGCGTGRYTTIFHERSYDITGIDISSSLIAMGKKTYPNLDIRHARIEDLLQNETRYRVILSLFTSFGYYEDDRDNLNFLKKMGELAEPGGDLWLDFLNADKVLREPLTDTVFRSQSGKTFQQRRRIRLPQPRVEKEIELYDEDGHYLKTYRESVRLYTLKDFETMLPEAGFEIKEIFGDYTGGEHSPNSPRLIIRGRKN